jgi:hypothetical protein
LAGGAARPSLEDAPCSTYPHDRIGVTVAVEVDGNGVGVDVAGPADVGEEGIEVGGDLQLLGNLQREELRAFTTLQLHAGGEAVVVVVGVLEVAGVGAVGVAVLAAALAHVAEAVVVGVPAVELAEQDRHAGVGVLTVEEVLDLVDVGVAGAVVAVADDAVVVAVAVEVDGHGVAVDVAGAADVGEVAVEVRRDLVLLRHLQREELLALAGLELTARRQTVVVVVGVLEVAGVGAVGVAVLAAALAHVAEAVVVGVPTVELAEQDRHAGVGVLTVEEVLDLVDVGVAGAVVAVADDAVVVAVAVEVDGHGVAVDVAGAADVGEVAVEVRRDLVLLRHLQREELLVLAALKLHAGAIRTIDPASVDTDNASRDKHLRDPDFFDVAVHKEWKFVSTKVEKGEGATLKVTGDLTLHGVTKPVVLMVEGPSPEMKDPNGKPHVALSATTTIKRQEFGLTWNRAIEGGSVVGDDVKIELEVELFKKR